MSVLTDKEITLAQILFRGDELQYIKDPNKKIDMVYNRIFGYFSEGCQHANYNVRRDALVIEWTDAELYLIDKKIEESKKEKERLEKKIKTTKTGLIMVGAGIGILGGVVLLLLKK